MPETFLPNPSVRLIVCPQDAAAGLHAHHAPCRVITLVSPDAVPVELPGLPAGDRLILRFNDIAGPRPGLVPPDRGMVAELLAFAADAAPGGMLLVHCWAGVSRSPAAAYAIACARAPAGTEAAIARRLRAAADFATPNPAVVAAADALLGRDGRMAAAIAAIGRGAEVGMGRPFVLEI